ncbi:U11/U12 small nuclear ribonucleoprotein 35 kDa protein [Oopsacas minuta]|uniref:U11/U12 small nuclear ribonucleoprotein 35 kDa protein n=1 Tax=Oopsacas minuta TaxID=111878 RepID=A0AAV7KH85_9METZ|nr:U11/U12 small nuclear ribonucleoprotein 35 kDa protein [Oopsacas minuta]
MSGITSSKFTTSYDPLLAGSIDGTDTKPHDSAVARAIHCEYTPKSDPILADYTLFVARLNPLTKEITLKEYFSRYGTVRKVTIVRDIVTGESKCYAFVIFKHRRDVEYAYNRAHHKLIDDREIIVDYELQHKLVGWKPRRLGGGLGGKKESGQLRFGGRERPFAQPIVREREGN